MLKQIVLIFAIIAVAFSNEMVDEVVDEIKGFVS